MAARIAFSALISLATATVEQLTVGGASDGPELETVAVRPPRLPYQWRHVQDEARAARLAREAAAKAEADRQRAAREQAERAERSRQTTPRQRAPFVPQSEIERIICSAAAEFGVDCGRMIRIARCESSLNPRAENRLHGGLLQHNKNYWPGRVREFNAAIDPDVSADIFDPVANARVSARMMGAGGWSHWQCKG